jgi:ABC-type sulfate transport system permease component
MGNAGAGFTVLLFLAGVFLAVAWIALPFAMFGIKPLLQTLIEEVRETNSLLRSSAKENPDHT